MLAAIGPAAALVAIQFLPVVFLAVPAGKAADRWGRRNLLLAAQAAMATLAAGLSVAVTTGRASYPVLLCFALLLGFGNSFSQPSRISLAASLAGLNRGLAHRHDRFDDFFAGMYGSAFASSSPLSYALCNFYRANSSILPQPPVASAQIAAKPV